MPITTQSQVVHTLVKVNVDMTNMTTWCYFARTLGDKDAGGVEMVLEGTDMYNLLMTQATAGEALGNEITDTIYNMALSKGVLDGAIS